MLLRAVLAVGWALALSASGGLHPLYAQKSQPPVRHAVRPSQPKSSKKVRVAPRAASSAPAALSPAAAPAAPTVPGVTYGVRVDPDTILVGMPFRVAVRVRAPRGATVVFPAGPDSGGAVEALDPRTVVTRPDSLRTDLTATYRLAAWDVGQQPVLLGPVVVHDRDAIRTISLGAIGVVVAPTVAARGGRRAPRPARPLYPDREPWWLPWAFAGAAIIALLLAWLVVRWWRRRARRVPPPIGALATAEREFAALDALDLPEAGETGRYVALLAEVVRSYLARRLPAATLSSTTGELLGALQGDPRAQVERLRALLTRTDLVKFAREYLTVDRAREIATEARSLVTDIDAAVIAAEEAAREAAARQASSELDARRASRASRDHGRAA